MITAPYPHLSPSGGILGHVSGTHIENPRFSQRRLMAQLYAWSTFKYWTADNADTQVVPPTKKRQTLSANSRANHKTTAKTGGHTYETGYGYPTQKLSEFNSSISQKSLCCS